MLAVQGEGCSGRVLLQEEEEVGEASLEAH